MHNFKKKKFTFDFLTYASRAQVSISLIINTSVIVINNNNFTFPKCFLKNILN